jgi:hypothetical protein
VSAPHDSLDAAVDAFRAAVFESTRTRLAGSQVRLGLKAALAALDALHPEPESAVHQPTVEKAVAWLREVGLPSFNAAASFIERELGAGSEDR